MRTRFEGKIGFLPFILGISALLAGCSMVGGGPAPLPSPLPPIPPREDFSPGPGSTVRTFIPPSHERALARLPREVRALWVVRTTLSHPDTVRAMVGRAARAGFNTLVVQVRGRGDAFYQSQWEPRPESVEAHGDTYDPLALVIHEAHARGISVHAWINTHLVGADWGLTPDPDHLTRSRPDLLGVPRELARELFRMDPWAPGYLESLLGYAQAHPDQIEGIYTAPSHPEVSEHLYSVWMDLLDHYDLDGLHFDYVRYPNPEFDYSRVSLERFKAWVTPRLSQARQTELEATAQNDPLAYVEALPGPWGEFRRLQITELVERIYYGVKKRKPDVLVSAAVFANADDAYRSRFQDWRGWLRAGILDVVAPMAYTPDNAEFESQIRTALEATEGRRVWAGVGVYRNTYEGTLQKILIARRLGTGGFSLFSYDWAVSQGESDGDRSLLDRIGAEIFVGR